MRNVVSGPSFKDRIVDQGRGRGMQFHYWLEVHSKRCFPEHTASKAIVPLKKIESGVYGDLITIYPMPYSIYFREPIS